MSNVQGFRPVVVSASEPDKETASEKIWVWLNSNDGRLYEVVDDAWVLVGGAAGLTGSKIIDGKRLTFTNGILTGYEVE